MRKPKVGVNWEEAKQYFLHPTEERNLLPPRQRQFSVAMLQWLRTICHPSGPVGHEIHACHDSLGKTECYWILNVFKIKIILFESISVLVCVFQNKFWGTVWMVRLFNLPTGKNNWGLTSGAVVTHQTWMLFLASSMRENYGIRARNCDSLVANATENWELVASLRLVFSPITKKSHDTTSVLNSYKRKSLGYGSY